MAAVSLAAGTAWCTFVQFADLHLPNNGAEPFRRAQTYLAAPEQYPIVLSGSSLTYMLPPEALSRSIYNLGTPSYGPMTGLEIIERSEAVPRLVLIETNLFWRTGEASYVDNLFSFPQRQMRKSLLAFRSGYDPLNVLAHLGRVALGRSETAPRAPEAVRQEFIQGERKSLSRKLDLSILQAGIASLKKQIAKLEAGGTKVGFYNLPIEASLAGLPGATTPAKVLKAAFGNYCWVDLSVPGGAKTIDGAHLVPRDAEIIAKQIRTAAANCLDKSK